MESELGTTQEKCVHMQFDDVGGRGPRAEEGVAGTKRERKVLENHPRSEDSTHILFSFLFFFFFFFFFLFFCPFPAFFGFRGLGLVGV